MGKYGGRRNRERERDGGRNKADRGVLGEVHTNCQNMSLLTSRATDSTESTAQTTSKDINRTGGINRNVRTAHGSCVLVCTVPISAALLLQELLHLICVFRHLHKF